MQPFNKMGHVHSLESFGLVDGPGVRFVVFLSGCNMRCKYCHNPDTWSGKGEAWTPQKLFDRAWRFHHYWKNNGGITVSGGDPLLQIDFLIEFFRLTKKHGVSTALDTSGNPYSESPEYQEKFCELMQYTDLVLLDLKEIDDKKHIELTGKSNSNILAMAKKLSDLGISMWIRHVLVPTITDDESGLIKMNAFIKDLKTVKRVEVLPYHTLGLSKWERLGIKYPLKGIPLPTKEQIAKAESLLKVSDYQL